MCEPADQPRQDTMAQRPMSDAAKASTSGYAWNPVSGRFVKKSGPTYLRMVKCGIVQDPSLFIVQRAVPDPAQAPAAAAQPPAPRRREAPPEAEYSDDDDDNDLAARIAELLTARKKTARPPTRLPRARVVVAPARAPARRRQVEQMFDTSTDLSESEC